MIKNITFPNEGKGYIYEKITKPEKPSKPTDRYCREYLNCKDDKEKQDLYNRFMTQYKEELSYYNKHKGEYICPCSNYLVGKSFDFEARKVNVIFGPNGSGKTTILKALAGNALIGDGWTKPIAPMEMTYEIGDVDYKEILKEKIEKSKKNSCSIDWDGVPIYFENFANTELSVLNKFGDLVGSIFENIGDEVGYLLSKNKMNLGNKSAMIINKVLNICEKPKTFSELFEPYTRQMKDFNDRWINCYTAQIDYYSSLPNANSGEPNTILFDEIDKSLDIENVLYLYTELLPKFAEQYGVQFILVSHSPIILLDKVYKSERYNIISLDEEYIEKCRKLLI